MGKKNTERRESAWLTVRQLADALDTTDSFVRNEVLRRVPADMVRRESRPMRVYARGAIEAWLRGTLSGPPGPALESTGDPELDYLLAVDAAESSGE